MSAWIGVDLDCTLAIFPHNFPDIGPPIPAMVERVKGWLEAGIEVRIFTARLDGSPGFVNDQRVRIEAWCEEHLGQRLPITATKDFEMVLLIDDRCRQVESNTGRLIGGEVSLAELAG